MMFVDIIFIVVGIISLLVIGGIVIAVVLTSKSKKSDNVSNGVLCSKCGCFSDAEYCSECGNKIR